MLFYKIDIQEEIAKKFKMKIKEDLFEFFCIMGNKSLFHIFNIELFLASNKYDWDEKNKFFRKEKGWHKSYRSSKNALLRYSKKYQEIYEGKFLFLITFLMTIIAIKNDFYRQLFESFVKHKPIFLTKRIIQNIIPKVHEKFEECDKAFINQIIHNNKKKYSLYHYKYTPLSTRNLDIDRKNIANFLKKINMDPLVINILSNISNKDYCQMKKYQSYFRDLLYSKNCPINEKLNYLKDNGYDFTNWIKSRLRNKFVHHLNVIFAKASDGSCTFKIIFGKYKNHSIKASDYYNGLCNIYALSDFLYIQLFNKPPLSKDQKGWKFSVDHGIKALKDPNLLIP